MTESQGLLPITTPAEAWNLHEQAVAVAPRAYADALRDALGIPYWQMGVYAVATLMEGLTPDFMAAAARQALEIGGPDR